jgi:hypothetical protein
MPKPKISAKELTSDIRAGVNYKDLKAKYNLTETALDSAFQKLVTSGLVKYEDLPENPSPRCPKCGMPQEQGEPHCKGCSIIRDVFKEEDQLPRIALKDLIEDVRAEKGFRDIRLRYDLSVEQLRKILEGLLQAGIIKENEKPDTNRSTESHAKGKEELLPNVQIPTEESHASIGSDDILFCPKCGQKRVEGANFCGRCGKALQMPSAETIEAGQSFDTTRSPVEPEKRVPVVTSNFVCPACATTLDRNFDECPACGVVISKWPQVQRRRAIMALFPQQTPTAEMFAKQLSSAPDFMPSAVVIGADQKTGLAVDYERSKVCLLGPGDQSRTLPSSYILSCDLTEDRRTRGTTTGKKSPVLRGVGGFLLAGPVGAMLGGMSGLGGGQESTSWEEVTRMDLHVTTKDPYYPNFLLNLLNYTVATSSDAYRNTLQYALQWKGALENLSQQVL